MKLRITQASENVVIVAADVPASGGPEAVTVVDTATGTSPTPFADYVRERGGVKPLPGVAIDRTQS